MQDLNKIAEKLKKQKNVGVDKNGQLKEKDPFNNGDMGNSQGATTLMPEKFFLV